MDIMFFVNSVLLGAGLAMDAFTVSLANGLHEPRMRRRKAVGIAGVFAGFQFLMPLIGWFCVHTVLHYFQAFEKLIPWIALGLLGFIGGKMLLEGIRSVRCPERQEDDPALGKTALLVQGIATSIDALSVGFTIADYTLPTALLAAGIIGAVTYVICRAGIALGRRAGLHLAGKASVVGGLLLIGIGIEIFVTHMW